MELVSSQDENMWNLLNKHLHSKEYVIKNKRMFNIPSPLVSASRGHYQGENAKKESKIFFKRLTTRCY